MTRPLTAAGLDVLVRLKRADQFGIPAWAIDGRVIGRLVADGYVEPFTMSPIVGGPLDRWRITDAGRAAIRAAEAEIAGAS